MTRRHSGTDMVPLLLLQALMSLAPTAPPRPVVLIGSPRERVPPDNYAPLQFEGSLGPWPSTTVEAQVQVQAEPPRRTDRAWRRAVARAGGGLVAEVCVDVAMGRRRPGAAWWDR
jgi:hypothetical protein